MDQSRQHDFSNILALEALLQTKSEKDLPDMQSDGVDLTYCAGTKSGLMDIYNLSWVIYVTDGSKGSTGIGAGFCRHDTKAGGCCRPELRKLCHPRPNHCGLHRRQRVFKLGWEGQGPSVLSFPGYTPSSFPGYILAGIIKVLHLRVSLGLFTMFIKIRAHRGEFFHEKADRWADKGREDVDNVRWDGPTAHLTWK